MDANRKTDKRIKRTMENSQSPELYIVKRDGKVQIFDPNKIRQAIIKAYRAGGINEDGNKVDRIVAHITDLAKQSPERKLAVEEIQDLVEQQLMSCDPYIAKKYIIYREWRNVERDRKTSLKQTMDGIVKIEKNDTNLGNANMSAHTPSGQMMTFASEITKDYTRKYLLSPIYSRAHNNGDIHIHDLDYYPTKTTTCVQYDLEDIFERGFRTKNGSVRTPQSIRSYATLATIVFQTNQNEQHGGQSIPAFDFFMAPGVAKSYRKHIVNNLSFILDLKSTPSNRDLSSLVEKIAPKLTENQEEAKRVTTALQATGLALDLHEVSHALKNAYVATRKDTHQAMEGFVHNLNTMHSRGGNQVVFSSVNYGTDTSPEGRMVILELLKATQEGLGQGEVPIFPIQIFKVKEGINYCEEDYELAISQFDKALNGELQYKTPNFDLLIESCKATAKALFPNFLFLDTPFNSNELWKADDPKRYLYEVATMGCRTRVFENLRGVKSSVGRGNLSFTSINMPRLAIEAIREAEEFSPDGSKEQLRREARIIFFDKVRKMSVLVADQLYDRYCYQRKALARQFPFMMRNDVWKGGQALQPQDEVGDVIASGTLGIGFIGGHNAMVAIYGEGHAHNKEAYNTLYEAIQVMNEVANEYKRKYNLNYSVLATPAEGLSGRFTRMDRKKYGIIPGVTDLDYYVNSFHIDVREPVGIAEKIKLEAPFHAITTGGHITYVELDGEAKKNVSVILKIVRTMKQEQIGYGSINHPIDTCLKCGYKGVIYTKCPICKSEQIERLRRITGYLTGSLDSWNSAKQAEEHDRIKHH
ncbi:ribonucleotide reductase of class III (anaerobic), large subunit [Porphyromonas crevioricanis JCM 15906]|uniref:Ribonucleotide reductase of class III (Anaerobic), large subunit n=2 Tax=Porphyromonas crevioricanis TaxID=393921 RepID=T1DTB2_9PORP|nr:ribonucleotide reductase of class III (anaerobic), large subunit [Porphyromonas crevioricanis JCM 15906]